MSTAATAPAPPSAPTSAPPSAPTSAPASAPASGWRPTKCAAYSYTPTGCTGSPENPSCTDSFQLHPDGRADKTFDDIITRGTYESSGTSVTIRVPRMKYEATFTIENDGEVLVGAGGARYQRADC